MVLSMDLFKFVSRYLRWSSQNLKSVRQTVVCETEPLERCSKGRIFFLAMLDSRQQPIV